MTIERNVKGLLGTKLGMTQTWDEETPWKPWRFMVPAKPLPLLVPVTSISSPAAKVSTASSWPTVYSEASAVRISARWRRGVTPALAK